MISLLLLLDCFAEAIGYDEGFRRTNIGLLLNVLDVTCREREKDKKCPEDERDNHLVVRARYVAEQTGTDCAGYQDPKRDFTLEI